MDKYEKQKREQLGMPYGTAAGRLRKMVLFKLLKQFGLAVCFRCEKLIETCEELTVDHKLPWLDHSPERFWDLDNVAFSHAFCNTGAARQTKKKRGLGPEGTEWCSGCQGYKKLEDFCICESRPNGLSTDCRECRKLQRQRRKHRQKLKTS